MSNDTRGTGSALAARMTQGYERTPLTTAAASGVAWALGAPVALALAVGAASGTAVAQPDAAGARDQIEQKGTAPAAGAIVDETRPADPSASEPARGRSGSLTDRKGSPAGHADPAAAGASAGSPRLPKDKSREKRGTP